MDFDGFMQFLLDPPRNPYAPERPVNPYERTAPRPPYRPMPELPPHARPSPAFQPEYDNSSDPFAPNSPINRGLGPRPYYTNRDFDPQEFPGFGYRDPTDLRGVFDYILGVN